jgi:CRISPR/Cas system-associated protein Cas10 (large subunit of type III CRISPR-Cas system)
MVECSKRRHFVRRAHLRDDNGKDGRRCSACRASDHAREEERRAEIRREQREANKAEDEREDVRARRQRESLSISCPSARS